MERFLAKYGQTDERLAEGMERVFKPGVIIENWEGMTTRQWLEEVVRLLRVQE